MERINYRITLDVYKNGIQRLLQGFETADNMARRVYVNLTSGGDTYEIRQNNVVAVMYVTTPNSTEPSIHDCTIEDNTIVYDVLPIKEEGITEMQLKLIDASVEGARKVILSPKFGVEVTESNANDDGVVQTNTFTALETAIAKAQAMYDSRIVSIDISEDCTFRIYYADGTVYENSKLHEALYNGNALLSESWAKGGTGIREGENTNNSKYYSNASRSAADDARMVYADARGLLNEAIKHTAFTSFLVDFANGNLEYMSQNSTFDLNEENGDLEFELSNDYDPEKLIGEVVGEFIEEKSAEINEKLETVDANTLRGHEPSYFATSEDLSEAKKELSGKLVTTTATNEANGLMGYTDKKNLDSVVGTYNLGNFRSKTIADLKTAIDSWLDANSNIANASAYFIADKTWITGWNSGDTSATITGGDTWTITNVAPYPSKTYTQLRISYYVNKEVYYVHRYNGTWGTVHQAAYKDDLNSYIKKDAFTVSGTKLTINLD